MTKKLPRESGRVLLTNTQIEFLKRFDEDEVLIGQMIRQGIEQQEVVLAVCDECNHTPRPHIVVKTFYDFLPQEDLICIQCLLDRIGITGP